jgi:hypothetical protein
MVCLCVCETCDAGGRMRQNGGENSMASKAVRRRLTCSLASSFCTSAILSSALSHASRRPAVLARIQSFAVLQASTSHPLQRARPHAHLQSTAQLHRQRPGPRRAPWMSAAVLALLFSAVVASLIVLRESASRARACCCARWTARSTELDSAVRALGVGWLIGR